jgi:uncharacterized membrane protein
MSDLVIITYEEQQTGFDALNKLGELQKMQLITLADAAVATKDEKGKVKVKQTLENQVTGSAALWGGFWGLLIGMFFLFPLAWGIAGALFGALGGKLADIGIDNKMIKEVGNSLQPGGSALFVMVVEATTDKVLDEMKKFGGHVYQTSLSKEDEEKLKAVLAHEDVAPATEEALELG